MASAPAAAAAMEGKAVAALRSVLQRVRSAAEKSGRKAEDVRVLAVGKTKPVSLIRSLYHAGHRTFAENYVQEFIDKAPQLPADIEWHFVGHLQTNKVKPLLDAIPNLDMIESVDSEKLANHLDRAIASLRRKALKVLVQVNTSGEESKSGVDPSDCVELAKHVMLGCPNLVFSGLMTIGMRDYSSTPENFKVISLLCVHWVNTHPLLSTNFKLIYVYSGEEALSNCRKNVCKALGIPEELCELSMGMSGDFEQAIEMGSTNVRIGSTIFGPREYPKRTGSQLPWKITAVALADTIENYKEKEKRLISDFTRIHKIGRTGQTTYRADDGLVHWVERILPRRFGKVLKGEIQLCREISQQTGILLDPIYTLAGWEQSVQLCLSESEKNTKVVMLHTGGTLGLFGLAQRYTTHFHTG